MVFLLFLPYKGAELKLLFESMDDTKINKIGKFYFKLKCESFPEVSFINLLTLLTYSTFLDNKIVLQLV
jgi:hypothetical protein